MSNILYSCCPPARPRHARHVHRREPGPKSRGYSSVCVVHALVLVACVTATPWLQRLPCLAEDGSRIGKEKLNDMLFASLEAEFVNRKDA